MESKISDIITFFFKTKIVAQNIFFLLVVLFVICALKKE